MDVKFLVIFLAFARSSTCNVKEAFTNHQLVPDLLSTAPTQLLHVTYKKTGKIVNLGNEIAPVDVMEAPEVAYYETIPDEFYTLILTDPDAPSRANPIRREFRHWLVVNIPGSDLNKGRTLSDYIGSGAPKGTDLHRYTFLLYQQPTELEFADEQLLSNSEIGDRPNFSTKNFADKYKLELRAGNFFQAKFDESVLELQKRLGLKP